MKFVKNYIYLAYNTFCLIFFTSYRKKFFKVFFFEKTHTYILPWPWLDDWYSSRISKFMDFLKDIFLFVLHFLSKVNVCKCFNFPDMSTKNGQKVSKKAFFLEVLGFLNIFRIGRIFLFWIFLMFDVRILRIFPTTLIMTSIFLTFSIERTTLSI